MRTGPTFEITREMAIANLRTVASRLGVAVLSMRLYAQHGSFSVDAIQRRHGWAELVREAGLQSGGVGGRPKQPRRWCLQECGRLSMSWPRWHLCRTCYRKSERARRGYDEGLLGQGRACRP